MTLKELKVGKSATVLSVGGSGALRQHFLDMGMIPGVEVTLIQYAPMGDPMELTVQGYALTLRLDDAAKIEIRESDPAVGERQKEENTAPNKENSRIRPENTGKTEKTVPGVTGEWNHPHPIEHPGFGEEGKYHAKGEEDPLPKGTVLTFALAGNQNCGKTTLFNQLTGSNQHVGNFPGVTVDQKSGPIRGHADTLVTDLPGIYSLSPYTSEEIVSRRFILEEKPTGIINIVDAMNIERNLYLTMQLMELGVPVVLALNMMDEVRGNGGTIRINRMEEMLGIPVVPISAASNEGIDELVSHALHIARYRECPGRVDFCAKDQNGGAVHRCLHSIMHMIEDHAEAAQIPVRFAASKLVEGDPLVTEALALSENEKETVEHIILQMEEESGTDRAAAIADMRFTFIRELCAKTVVKPQESREHARSRRIDRILTGKYTALPAFVAIMALIFYLTFDLFGGTLQHLLDRGITALSEAVSAGLLSAGVNEILRSLIIDGIFKGVGSIISFLPIIVILFFFLSMLEDSGYMARVAFVTDKLLRRIGLSGRSIVPMLIGFGCTVPGVMASRTLPSARDRKMTVMLTPFMSCTAKLPIYGFFAAAFFPRYTALIVIGLYLFGILCGILTAHIAKRTLFRGEPVPFVMELPNYRLPGVRNVAHLLWDKAKDFLQRAFTVIFIASIVVWFLQSFSFRLSWAAGSGEASILSVVAGFLAPVFRPVGFGDWRVVVALIAGFMAKESVVSTLSVLAGTAAITSIVSPLGALSLLVFCLLYSPCVASIAAIRRELGHGWAAGVALFQCALAWVMAGAVYGIGSLIALL